MSTARRMMMRSGAGATFDWSGLIDGSLSGDIVVPDGMTLIKDQCFYKCANITSITIPDSVVTIEQTACRVGINLQRVDVGSGVTTIGQSAFYADNNSNLVLIFRSVVPPTISSNTFGSVRGQFYVPDDSVEDYKAAQYWSNLAGRINPLSDLVGE